MPAEEVERVFPVVMAAIGEEKQKREMAGMEVEGKVR
jgi:hypothetical protein